MSIPSSNSNEIFSDFDDFGDDFEDDFDDEKPVKAEKKSKDKVLKKSKKPKKKDEWGFSEDSDEVSKSPQKPKPKKEFKRSKFKPKKDLKTEKPKKKPKISLDDKAQKKIELEDCFNKLKHMISKQRIRFMKLCEEYGDRFFKSKKAAFKKRCEGNPFAFDYYEILLKGILPFKQFIDILGMFDFKKIGMKNGKEFLKMLKCYRSKGDFVEHYHVVASLTSKKAFIFEGSFKSLKKDFKKFNNKEEATRFIQKIVKDWIKTRVKRKEARDEVRLKK